MTDRFEIAGREIGTGAPGYLIAEVAQAHDGSLGTAHAFIDAAMLTAKKPSTGIPADALDTVIGRQLLQAVPADRLLTWEDIDVPA